jgi:transcriptional regulator with XRE-family HTH domain
MSLDHRIRLLIKSKNISQSELARKLDVTRGSVNLWLSGKQVPGQKQLMKLFELFPDISADWLLLGRGEMSYDNKHSGIDSRFLEKQLIDQGEKMGLYEKLLQEKDERIVLLENIISLTSKKPSRDNK